MCVSFVALVRICILHLRATTNVTALLESYPGRYERNCTLWEEHAIKKASILQISIESTDNNSILNKILNIYVLFKLSWYHKWLSLFYDKIERVSWPPRGKSGAPLRIHINFIFIHYLRAHACRIPRRNVQRHRKANEKQLRSSRLITVTRTHCIKVPYTYTHFCNKISYAGFDY